MTFVIDKPTRDGVSLEKAARIDVGATKFCECGQKISSRE
jgi:hypothetical protein